MDGVLVDSEKFWKQAEYEVFTALGVNVTREGCLQTQSMTTKEVTRFWYEKFQWNNTPLNDVEQMVINRVIELIRKENCGTIGIKAFIESLNKQGYKIGLATNSPQNIIPVVLEKIGTTHLFDAVSSADSEVQGKPSPAIYLTTAKKLNVEPYECVAIEDSHSGMLAAIEAGMTVIAFTNENTEINFDIAHHKILSFMEY